MCVKKRTSSSVSRESNVCFSADETTDVGYNSGTLVYADTPTGRFTGTINSVKLELGDDTHDHLVDSNHVMSVAMSLQ